MISKYFAATMFMFAGANLVFALYNQEQALLLAMFAIMNVICGVVNLND